jgi:hypothetical protein
MVPASQSEAQSEHQSEYQSEAQSEAQSEHQSEAQSEHQSEAQSEHQSEAQSEHQSEAQSEYQSEAQSEHQSEAQSEDETLSAASTRARERHALRRSRWEHSRCRQGIAALAIGALDDIGCGFIWATDGDGQRERRRAGRHIGLGHRGAAPDPGAPSGPGKMLGKKPRRDSIAGLTELVDADHLDEPGLHQIVERVEVLLADFSHARHRRGYRSPNYDRPANGQNTPRGTVGHENGGE